jgi:hypothetical protein
MANAGDMVVNFLGNAKHLEQTARGVQGTLGNVVSFAKRAAIGIGAAFTFREGLAAIETQVISERKLEAVLKATGGAAGLAADEIKNLASERQSLTNFSDEATIAASAMLATFKEIKGDIFKEAIVAAQDLSSVMEQDLKSSVVQLGKALNNPIKGVTALTRVGVDFTDQQIEQIKVMQKSGDILGAQKIILKELQTEFGGAAEAMATGSVQMKNSLGDITESIGMLLLPAFNDFAQVVVGVTPSIISSIDTIAPVFVQLGDMIGGVFQFIGDTAATIFDFVGLSGVTSLKSIVEYSVGFLASVEYVFQNLATLADFAFTSFLASATTAFNETIHFFTGTMPELLDWFSQNWSDVFFTASDLVATIFINMGTNIRSIMGEIWDFIKTGGIDSLEVAWTPLTEGFVNTIRELPELTAREVGLVEAELLKKSAELGSSFSGGLVGHVQKRMEELLPQFKIETPTDKMVKDFSAPLVESVVPDVIESTASKVGGGSQSALTAISGADAISAVNAFNREQEQRRADKAEADKQHKEKVALAKRQAEASEGVRDEVKTLNGSMSIAGAVT